MVTKIVKGVIMQSRGLVVFSIN